MTHPQGKNGHPQPRKTARILLPLLVAACIAFIIFNSSQSGAASGQVSQQVTAWVSGDAEVPAGTGLETLIRKAGHVAEYALLGLLLHLCLWAYRRLTATWCIAAVCFAHLVAILDECYQLTVPGRSGRISDVFIDTAGALLGMALGAAVLRVITLLHRRQPPHM
ncbi:VanZ family protein [Clostridia bacterium OttesenSCG-928-O13]|nr:VanZ family protein [Clostridia bacterium OttesenSCG-928-O13]